MATAEPNSPAVDLAAVNGRLAQSAAEDRIAWAYDTFGQSLVLSSSFGAQAAVMVSLASRVAPNIPVLFVDTGYLFPETYQFADLLAERGAAEVWCMATHAVLSDPAIDRLKNSALTKVVVTNTLPIAPDRRFDKLEVLSVAQLISSAIDAVFEDSSVSEIFGGENLA